MFLAYAHARRARALEDAASIRSDLGDALQELAPHGIAVRAHRELQRRLVGDHVVLGPGVDRTHGDHGGFHRINPATDQRLHRNHEGGRGHDGVDGLMGARAVPAPAMEGHVHRIDVGEGIARRIAETASGQAGIDMQRQGVVGPGKIFEEPIGQHIPGPLADLLGGLSNDHEGSAPERARQGEQSRIGHQVGDVDIVPAGVHHPRGSSIGQHRGDLARVVETRLLAHRQGIHIAPNQQRGARTVLEHRHHPGAPHSGIHPVAGALESVGNLSGGLGLLQGEFRVGMKMLIEFNQPIEVLVDPLVHELGLGRSAGFWPLGGNREGRSEPKAGPEQASQEPPHASTLCHTLPSPGVSEAPGARLAPQTQSCVR